MVGWDGRICLVLVNTLRYAKDREVEQQIRSAEFRAAKRVEEEAMMAALGIKVMPPPPGLSDPEKSLSLSKAHARRFLAASMPPPPPKPVIKREPRSASIKNEPMTPAIHQDPRNSMRQQPQKKQDRHKEDRRLRRQLKATGSDEEKNDWSEDDADDLMGGSDEEDEDSDDDKCEYHSFLDSSVEAYGKWFLAKVALQQNTMTEKELDDFLIDLVKKHSMKEIQAILKGKK